MNNIVSIFQIYFDDNTRKHLDPAFIPYFNTSKDGYFENSVIKELYEKYRNTQDTCPAYIGTTSWKQKLRTGIDGHEIISHILKDIELGIEKDVYLFTPVSNIVIKNEGVVPPQYEYNGIIREEDLLSIHKRARPDAYRAYVELDNSGVLPFKLINSKWCYSHSNYWVVKMEVFNKYCETVLLPAIQWFERPDIKNLFSDKNFAHASGHAHPIYSFILEVTFGTFLAHSDYSYSYICKKKTGRRIYSKVNILAFSSTSENAIHTIVPAHKAKTQSSIPAQVLVAAPDINMSAGDVTGVYLQRFKTNEADCASDRIRGEWIAANSGNKIEIFNKSKKYKVIIFHTPCEEIKAYGDIKLLDICDPVWKNNQSKFLELIKSVHAIIVPTEGLKQELQKITDKKIYVIGDGHDSNHYSSVIRNPHLETAKEVVWFGYAENAHCLLPYIDCIKKNNLKLKVISQRQNEFPLTIADRFIKWDIKTYINEIAMSDFAILPTYNKNKSDNKEITAILCGIPVAKTVEDIERFISPQERKLEIERKKNIVSKYDAKNRADEYIAIINEIIRPIKEDITVYSAITGGYEKTRNDIRVFRDSPDDKFRIDNMNAKLYKVLSHKFLESKYSIWMDGNIMAVVDENKIVKELLSDADIAVFKHPHRNCLYQEYIQAQKRLTPEFHKLINEQVINYRKENMPENFGLAECGVILRKHSDIVSEFNEKWWAEICRYTQRDQVSFPYVWWKMRNRIKIKLIDGNVRQHPYFKYLPR